LRGADADHECGLRSKAYWDNNDSAYRDVAMMNRGRGTCGRASGERPERRRRASRAKRWNPEPRDNGSNRLIAISNALTPDHAMADILKKIEGY